MADPTNKLGATEISPAPAVFVHRSRLLKQNMPGLDALRGLAVLGVVCQHGIKMMRPPAVADSRLVQIAVAIANPGWLGVTLFFVLSGFLITGILLDTRTRENYWRGFYVRRMLRILPLYLLTLVLLKFGGVSWRYVGFCLLFLANLVQYRMASYGPLWSLAVEEQFYLFWPLIVRRSRLRSLALLCGASIVLSPLLRGLSAFYPIGNPYSDTWLITDYLSLGALIAVILRSRYSSPRNIRRAIAALAGLSAAWFALCLRFHMLSRTTPLGTAFQTEPFLLLFGLLLLLALRFGDNPWLLLIGRPLRFFGYISYGLYLMNVAGFSLWGSFTRGNKPPLAQLTLPVLLESFLAPLALMTLICFLSRAYFEEYFLRLKHRLVAYPAPRHPQNIRQTIPHSDDAKR